MKKLRSSLRPADLVALAFAVYCFARLLLAHHIQKGAHDKVIAFPRTDIMLAFMLVLIFKVARSPELLAAEERRRFDRMYVLIAVLMVVISNRGQWRVSIIMVFSCLVLFLGLVRELYLRRHGSVPLLPFMRLGAGYLGRALHAWLPLLVMIFFYPLIPIVIQSVDVADQDALLSSLDVRLFAGHDPLHLLEAVVSRPLSEWLALCYTVYGPLFPVVLTCVYIKDDPAPFDWLILAISATMAIGYIGYSLVPALGPSFTQKFAVGLDLHYMLQIKEKLMDRTRIPRDVFPSLHTALSLVLLYGCWRHVRTLFWLALPFVACIPLACVYLRYHYVVDVIAGAALAVLVVLGSELAERRRRTVATAG